MTDSAGTVITYITRKHRRYVIGLLLKRLFPVYVILAAATILFAWLFSRFPYTVFPFLFDLFLLAGSIATVTIIVVTFFIKRPHSSVTARRLDKELASTTPHPLLHIALEFTKGKHTPADDTLRSEVFNRAGQQITLHRRLVSPRRNNPFIPLQCSTIACSILFVTLFHPTLIRYLQLPLNLMTNDTYDISPGTVSVPQNASLTITLHTGKSRVPSTRITLYYPDSRTSSGRRLRPDSGGAFTFTADSLTRSFIYRFSHGTFTSAPETVTVVPPPYLTSLQALITAPEYTGIDSSTLVQGQGDLTLYEGSGVRFTLASPGLSSAALILGTDTISCVRNGSTAQCSLSIHTADQCHFALVDTFGQRTDSSGRFSIRIIPDELPQVRFIRPGRDKNLEPTQVETLFVEATDDLGIRKAYLSWYRGNARDTAATVIPFSVPPGSHLWQNTFVWNISRLSLYPGDTLYYWATVWDSYPFKPRHTAVTDTFMFRVPTFQEMHQSMADRESHARNLLSQASERQEQIEQQVEQLDKATSRSSGKEPSWEQKELAERVKESLQEQTDSLNEALKDLQKNAEKLRDEGVLNNDLARKMEEIKKAVEELVKQYGDSLLFPKNSTRDLSLSEMKDAVQKLQQMLPELGERLDNTLKYLEALKKDRELATLAAEAEKLAQEQALLAQEGDNADAAQREANLLKRTAGVSKETSDRLSPDNNPDLAKTLSEIGQTSSELNQELSRSQPPSKSSMRQLSGSLASLAQQIREQTADYRMQQLAALRDSLLDMANRSIQLASWQEQIGAMHPTDEQARRRQALQQQALSQSAGILENQLGQLGALPPSLTQQLTKSMRSSRQAANATVEALGAGSGSFAMNITAQSFRQSANDLLGVVEAMDGQNSSGNCQSGSGLQESLRRMSGKQAAINAATASLLRQMLEGRSGRKNGPGGESPGTEGERREAVKQAQKRQQELADDLKKLAEKFGNADDASVKKRIGDLEQEARALAAMLNSPREEVTERQDRFLARMLQAALSLHREEEGKEDRKSTTAKTIFTIRAPASTDSTVHGNDAFFELRRKALENGSFPPAYRTSINAYFDSLGTMYLR